MLLQVVKVPFTKVIEADSKVFLKKTGKDEGDNINGISFIKFLPGIEELPSASPT
jgi:hypothetical protein